MPVNRYHPFSRSPASFLRRYGRSKSAANASLAYSRSPFSGRYLSPGAVYPNKFTSLGQYYYYKDLARARKDNVVFSPIMDREFVRPKPVYTPFPKKYGSQADEMFAKARVDASQNLRSHISSRTAASQAGETVKDFRMEQEAIQKASDKFLDHMYVTPEAYVKQRKEGAGDHRDMRTYRYAWQILQRKEGQSQASHDARRVLENERRGLTPVDVPPGAIALAHDPDREGVLEIVNSTPELPESIFYPPEDSDGEFK